jgi:hypothetical protein
MSLSKIIAAAVTAAIPHIVCKSIPVRDLETREVLFDLGEVRIASLRQDGDGSFRFELLGDTEHFGRWNGTSRMAAIFRTGQKGPVSFIPLNRIQQLAELQESQPDYKPGRHEGPVTVVRPHLRRTPQKKDKTLEKAMTTDPEYATELPEAEPTGA